MAKKTTNQTEETAVNENVVVNNNIFTHSEEDFINEKPNLLKMDPNDVKDPTTPVKVTIVEGKDLAIWCKGDKPELIRDGIKESIIDSLLLRAELLQWTESRWLEHRFDKKEVHRRWVAESKEGYDLQSRILHDFTFAYRNNPEVLKILKIIKNGRGHADLFQDLSDLPVIGRANIQELTEMNFDMSLLDKAEEKAKSLGTLLAMSRAEDTNHDFKDLRDRAYTYLKIAVDEVRAGGQHLFWHNEERLKGYRSRYNHSHNSNRNNVSSELANAINS